MSLKSLGAVQHTPLELSWLRWEYIIRLRKQMSLKPIFKSKQCWLLMQFECQTTDCSTPQDRRRRMHGYPGEVWCEGWRGLHLHLIILCPDSHPRAYHGRQSRSSSWSPQSTLLAGAKCYVLKKIQFWVRVLILLSVYLKHRHTEYRQKKWSISFFKRSLTKYWRNSKLVPLNEKLAVSRPRFVLTLRNISRVSEMIIYAVDRTILVPGTS